MQLTYYLTDAAIERAFVHDGTILGGPQRIHVDEKELTIAQRSLLVSFAPMHCIRDGAVTMTGLYTWNATAGIHRRADHVLRLDGVAESATALLDAWHAAEQASHRDAQSARDAACLALIGTISEAERMRAEPPHVDDIFKLSPYYREACETERHARASWEQWRSVCEAAARDDAQAIARAVDAYNADRDAWIVAHGSGYLSALADGEYPYDAVYVAERAADEYPDFSVDADEHLTLSAMDAPPTEHMLEEATRHGARIMMAVEGDGYYDDRHAALVIENFLGRHRLVRVLR